MSMKKDRRAISEWMNAIEKNLDYNGEKHTKMKFAVCKLWVMGGYGDDWFVGDDF